MPEPVPPPTVPASRQLGRYEVIAEIASGGMGTVVLARLAGAGGFQRLFAIKLLHPHNLEDPEFIRMFLDEARIAAKIHHPNVVGIQEIAEDPKRGFYFVMDYVEGWPLASLMETLAQPDPARWRVAHRVLLDALTGLDAAHHLRDEVSGEPLRVVHRDFSPQNVLVGVDGIARVTDFGVAKASARMSSTRAGQVKGKLAYMAPEQARGGALDARTDVFAAGIMLWEALTAKRLFKRPSAPETGHAILNAPIPLPHAIVREVPEALSAVAMKALARDVSQRYPSARAMAEALESAARATDQLASVHEVGAWLRATFGQQIAARRDAIRAAMQDDGARPVVAGLNVPQLPEQPLAADRAVSRSDSGVKQAEPTLPTSTGRLPVAPPSDGPAADGDTPISDARIVATLLSGRAAPSEPPPSGTVGDETGDEDPLADEGATELDDAARVAAMLKEMGQAPKGAKAPATRPVAQGAEARARANAPPRPLPASAAPPVPAAPTAAGPVAPATFKLLGNAAPAPPTPPPPAWDDDGVATAVIRDGSPRPTPGTLPERAIAFDDEVSTDVYRPDSSGAVHRVTASHAVAAPPDPFAAPALDPFAALAPAPARTASVASAPTAAGPSLVRRIVVAVAWVIGVVVCGTALGLAIRSYLDRQDAAASEAPAPR